MSRNFPIRSLFLLSVICCMQSYSCAQKKINKVYVNKSDDSLYVFDSTQMRYNFSSKILKENGIWELFYPIKKKYNLVVEAFVDSNKIVQTLYRSRLTGDTLELITYKDSIKNGIYIYKNPKGDYKESGSYLNGKKEGLWKIYYDNIHSIEFYKEDKVQKWITYHENNVIHNSGLISNGCIKDSVFIYDKFGNRIEELYFKECKLQKRVDLLQEGIVIIYEGIFTTHDELYYQSFSDFILLAGSINKYRLEASGELILIETKIINQ